MESNNDFYSFQGSINRKNYIINMLILIILCILVHFLNFDYLKTITKYELLYNTLIWIISFFKFILLISVLSVVYRRINDFSGFNNIMKYIFTIFYLYPFLLWFFRYQIIQFFPNFILNALIISFLIIIPFSIISSIIFAFIKSK